MAKDKNNKNKGIGMLGVLLKEAGVDAKKFNREPNEKKASLKNKEASVIDDKRWENVKQTTQQLSKKPNVGFIENGKGKKQQTQTKKTSISTTQKQTKKRRKRLREVNHQPDFDLSCYDSNTRNDLKNQNIAPQVFSPDKIKVLGEMSGNRSAFPEQLFPQRKKVELSGIECDLGADNNEENEIIIGLDFGTSNTKIVIHDPQRKVFYAVPFFAVGISDAFLYPCQVFLNNHQYSLDGLGQCFADLKLPLIYERTEAENIRHAVAFLALIIRHARGWFLSEHAATYKNVNIIWALNLGLPAASYEKTFLKERFKQIAFSAINLSADSSEAITDALVNKYYELSQHVFNRPVDSEEFHVHPDLVNVYPEIAAQVIAFIESDSWDDKDRPFITMIDIGAGTVDISFFSVKRARRNHQFNFFSNSVELNGVINLHRKRTQWLTKILKEKNILKPEIQQFLDDISVSTIQYHSIPESVNDYILNLETSGNKTIDGLFFSEYKKQVATLLKNTRKTRVPLNNDNWKRLPIFLCGGGSRMNFYRAVIAKINQLEPSWLHVELQSLNKPQNLRAEGLSEAEYDRLSVAYGLSFPELGKIVSSSEIDDFSISDLPIRERPVDLTDDG